LTIVQESLKNRWTIV